MIILSKFSIKETALPPEKSMYASSTITRPEVCSDTFFIISTGNNLPVGEFGFAIKVSFAIEDLLIKSSKTTLNSLSNFDSTIFAPLCCDNNE